ncbi:aldo-keto reductase Mvan_2161-like [Sycon ciliatum]|uniref:aldo-keto reductase Mvan_2161-like n=1 Tax=Sycon ciliatum TaxID=27933 RepID=UPI0031F62C8B
MHATWVSFLLGLVVASQWSAASTAANTTSDALNLPACAFRSTVPSVPLWNAARPGLMMPIVGLGTGHCNPRQGGECMNNKTARRATLDFLRAGGRRIDTAITYHDQTGIGRAIRHSRVPREEVFITSKVGPGLPLGYQDILDQTQTVLKELNTSYVDLLLIHWPGPPGNSSDADCRPPHINYTLCRLNSWRAMIKVLQMGSAHAIGISNYEFRHVGELLFSGLVFPAVNQVEFHPYFEERPLKTYCNQHNITYNGYSPFAANDWAPYFHHWPHSLLNDTMLQKIATAHGRTPAQVALRFQVQLGLVVNPRTQNFEHMKENVNIFDFELSQDDMTQITYLTPPSDNPKIFPDPYKIP